LIELRKHIPGSGLRSPFRGKKLAALAEQVVDISSRGLERRAILNREGKDERIHLAPIAALVAQAKTPADVLLEGLKDGPDLKKAILERATV
jgi:glutamate--cysteine ligase